jgi:myosin heavy subunit
MFGMDVSSQYMRVGASGNTGQHLSRDPHIFAVAQDAYQRMMTEEEAGAAQSILVSGESGSGKTHACKFLMKHLSSISALQCAERGDDGGLFSPRKGSHRPMERQV